PADYAERLAALTQKCGLDGVVSLARAVNGMASRRPRLDALRNSWYDLDAHYDALETRFWQF
ncbi:ACP phosphodiesterase, partial [Escherichia coli]|nr:ACP phosphodiesterase [Escherichia coli]